MGKRKRSKRSPKYILLIVLLIIGLSGPFHEPKELPAPLFGTVKVQLSSGAYPADSKSLSAVVTPGDLESLSLFPSLTYVDFTGSACHSEINAWAAQNPHIQVRYSVTLPDGSSYDNTAANIDLSRQPSGTLEQTIAALNCLPALESLSLGKVGGDDSALSLADVASLRAAFPDLEYDFSLDLLGQSVEPNVESLDLSSLKAQDVEEASAVLACLPKLSSLKLSNELSIENVTSLAASCPKAAIDYSMNLYGKDFNLKDEKLDFNHIKMEDKAQALREILPLMRSCTYLDMDYCGVDNDTMAAIRDENPNMKVVWRIWFGENYSVRTDTERILASKPTVGGMIYDATPIKYCTDLKYLDVGHNEELFDLSFASELENLEVLIIAMTAISDLSPLENCKKLEYLEIQTSPVTDISVLKNCPDLAHLNICELEGLTDISSLMDLTKLERVWIGLSTPIPEEQVTELRSKLPNCEINTTAWEPHAEYWRFFRYDPEIPKYYWTPRHELLREQLGYNYQEYSFFWLDPLCGDPAPAEFAGMFGKEVYG